MPTYFEIKRLKNGYEWREMFENQLGFNYAVDVLKIPPGCIEAIKCDPKMHALGVLIKEDAHLTHNDWFYALVQTHTYFRTDDNLIVFY